MEVEITVTIRDEGKTVESFSGVAVYNGWKDRKVSINSSSLGTEEQDKKNVKEIVGEVCDKFLFKTMSLR